MVAPFPHHTPISLQE